MEKELTLLYRFYKTMNEDNIVLLEIRNYNKYGNKKWRVALLRVNRKCICERISNVEKLRDIWIICQIKKNRCCWTEHFAYMENYTLHHKFKKLCYAINWRWNNAENFNC